MKPKYSGKESKKFWDKINKIKDPASHSEAYSLGVVLQNVESDILRLIKIAQQS